MQEMKLFLKPDGLLLVGVPVGEVDDCQFPGQRIYGPSRLPLLFHGFELLGSVWNGTLVRGGLPRARQKREEAPPKVEGYGRGQAAPRPHWSRWLAQLGYVERKWDVAWTYQPVFALRPCVADRCSSLSP